MRRGKRRQPAAGLPLSAGQNRLGFFIHSEPAHLAGQGNLRFRIEPEAKQTLRRLASASMIAQAYRQVEAPASRACCIVRWSIGAMPSAMTSASSNCPISKCSRAPSSRRSRSCGTSAPRGQASPPRPHDRRSRLGYRPGPAPNKLRGGASDKCCVSRCFTRSLTRSLAR